MDLQIYDLLTDPCGLECEDTVKFAESLAISECLSGMFHDNADLRLTQFQAKRIPVRKFPVAPLEGCQPINAFLAVEAYKVWEEPDTPCPVTYCF
mmetsp:Transcript_6511/g.8059  ORF Transcript_6511/g.8059 Transcript_6511/m.8059 type:complete len:95 (+) Transcript_6511:31-315(+)